jgi:septal ring factor EnvC (AmiA/AmiB activator)
MPADPGPSARLPAPAPTRRAPRPPPRWRLLRQSLAALLGLWLAGLPAASPGVDEHALKAAELRQLRQQMGELRKRLDEAHSSRSAQEEALRTTELQLGQLDRQLRSIGRALRAKRQRLDSLSQDRDRLRAELAAQREGLARELRAAYVLGRQDYLRLLLNQQDPAELERVLTYYRYFSQARAHRIRTVRKQLARLSALEQQIREETRSLDALQARAAARKAERETQQQEREQVLAALRAEIREGGEQLERLQENEKRLERLLQALREMFSAAPQAADGRKPFKDLKGQLPWPAKGRLTHEFGTRRRLGDLKWQGVLIDAGAGNPVRAVYSGRVAFADWLRGLGLLLIIDHGQGFMSLYGHNQTLLKETGDWVAAGEAVATVGDTGGAGEAGLYFEIRRRGVPVNPAQWCRRG